MVGPKENITLQVPTHTQDTYGAKVRAWTDIAELKCTIAPVGSSEAMAMNRPMMEFTHRAWFDYYAISGFLDQLKPSGRIKWSDTYYDIVGIEKHMRRAVVLTIRLSI